MSLATAIVAIIDKLVNLIGLQKQQATQIENLSNKVNTLQVGAVNLLFDSEFVNASNYLNRSTHSKSVVSNRTIIKVEPNITTGPFGVIHGGASKKTSIEKSVIYTLSFYARAYQAMPLNYIYLMRTEAGGNAYLPRINVTAEWQRYSITFVAPWNSATVSMLIGSNTTYSDGAWFEIHSVKLERGDIATDWTPSLADEQAKYAALEARIAALESKFSGSNGTVGD